MLAVVKMEMGRKYEGLERAFLSKEELAEQAGLDRNTIGRIENAAPPKCTPALSAR